MNYAQIQNTILGVQTFTLSLGALSLYKATASTSGTYSFSPNSRLDMIEYNLMKNGFIPANAFGAVGIAGHAGINPTRQGINSINNHLNSTGMTSAENSAMISRIENSLSNGTALTGADANFYLHELKESFYMQSGMSYEVAHKAALDFYGVSPYSVYHPTVIQQFPDLFNSNWFNFWGIK